jgi:hypothetical protein
MIEEKTSISVQKSTWNELITTIDELREKLDGADRTNMLLTKESQRATSKLKLELKNAVASIDRLNGEISKISIDAERWRSFANSPQTALMLGTELDPNSQQDWVTECNRLVDSWNIVNKRRGIHERAKDLDELVDAYEDGLKEITTEDKIKEHISEFIETEKGKEVYRKLLSILFSPPLDMDTKQLTRDILIGMNLGCIDDGLPFPSEDIDYFIESGVYQEWYNGITHDCERAKDAILGILECFDRWIAEGGFSGKGER